METVLLHLHPDFAYELESVSRKWNGVQNVLAFRGITPPKELEAKLMTGGAISLAGACKIARQIRVAAKCGSKDGIIVFTEKRVSSPPYGQLFFGGSRKITVISLDFPQKLFSQSSEKQTYIFRALLNNILDALCQEAGLDSHYDETLGCVLDFCDNMPDIIKGIEGGPRFCNLHLREVTQKNKAYLLALVNAVANTSELAQLDVKISKRIITFDNPVDVGIVIALTEEFREFFSLIQSKAKSRPKPTFNDEINQYYYLFEMGNNNPYRCVVTFIGGMGTDNAALVGDRLLHQFKPATIVNVGIAGSMDKEARVGDIVIAEQADKYLHAAKATAVNTDATFDFQLSGDPYKSTPDYVSHARNLEFAYPEDAKKWFHECASNLRKLLDGGVYHQLIDKKVVREHPQIHVGHIASDIIVGATDLFVKWLKNHRDRKYLALEMEAAGILHAAHTRTTTTLVIRGVSDYSNTNKEKLDQIEDGVLRRYAMVNAILLLWLFMDLQPLKRSS